MTPGPAQLGVHPGSRSPANAEEVEMLLRAVPAVCFREEFADQRFAPQQLSERATPDELTRLASPEWLDGLLEALAKLEDNAGRNQNGGLQFLAHTLSHFLSVQKLRPDEHPLAVGLYLRSYARKNGTPDEISAVGRKMDLWEPAAD
jgi:hypothetical protein